MSNIFNLFTLLVGLGKDLILANHEKVISIKCLNQLHSPKNVTNVIRGATFLVYLSY